MKTKLFISLSVVALFGLSATAYGTLYINGRDKDGNLPKSDCWEMKCPNGCVEEEGTLTGHCCPGDDVCRVDGKDISECCGEGKTCKEGKCQAEQEVCEPHLFKKSANQMKNSKDGVNPVICCDGEITTAANTDASTQGYEEGSNTQKGCCPKERTNKVDSDPQKWTCCTKTQKAVSTGCCAADKIYVDIDGEEKCCPGTSKASKTKPGVCCLNNYVYGGSVDAMACGCPEGKQKYTEDGEEKCCPVDDLLLPTYDESCNATCGCFDPATTELTCSTSGKCACPKDYGWDSTNGKCLPYCTKDMGVFLLVDRSGSTFAPKGSSGSFCGSGEPCERINKLLDKIKLGNRNYAFYHNESDNCGYDSAMSVLPFGQHSASEYDLWKGMNHKFVCTTAENTRFDKAIKHIKSKYCKRNNPIVIMIITDGEVQKGKDDMASAMNHMIDECDARIVYIGPDGTKLKKNMTKNVTNFESYSFTDNIQSWIDGTNEAIAGSCIPTDEGYKSFSKSEDSWFCNVLKNKTSTHSYWYLTQEECLSCPSGKVKWRVSSDSNYKSKGVGVCCGENNNSDNCKVKKGRIWYRKDEDGEIYAE